MSDNDLLIEYEYCATCGGALSERVEYDGYVGGNVVSWLRYEYEGLNLLRIDERYDDDDPANGIDSGDPWRPLNVFVHAPGSIGQIVRSKWYNYRDCTTTPCDSGYYYYFYDALGNVAGVYDENTDQFIDYEMDAFGNDLPGGNSFLAMDQCGPKEHLTGKMYDTDTGLYYFHARWYDPEVGRFVGRDPAWTVNNRYGLANLNTLSEVDPTGKQVLQPYHPHPKPPEAKDCSRLEDWAGCCRTPDDYLGKYLSNECVQDYLRDHDDATPEKAYEECKPVDWDDPVHRKAGIYNCGVDENSGSYSCNVWYIPSGNTCLDICRCAVDEKVWPCMLTPGISLDQRVRQCEIEGLNEWFKCMEHWFGNPKE